MERVKSDNKDINNDGFDYDNFPIKSYPQTGIVDDAEFENLKAALAAANEAGIEQASAGNEDPDTMSPSDTGTPDSIGGSDIKISVTGKIPWQAKVLCGVIAAITCITMVVIVSQVLRKKK